MTQSRKSRRAKANGRVRVAILGGGLGGLATAWMLSSKRWREKVQVTIYEASWAPGGKAVSGRSLEPPHEVREHGLHMLFGTYWWVWQMIAQSYDELSDPPFGGIEGAFTPRQTVHFAGQRGAGLSWGLWTMQPPRRGGEEACPWSSADMPLDDSGLVGALLDEIEDRLEKLPMEILSQVPRAAAALPLPNLGGRGEFAANQDGEPSWTARAKRILSDLESVHRVLSLYPLIVPVEWLLPLSLGMAAQLRSSGSDVRNGIVLLDLAMALLRGIIRECQDGAEGVSFDSINNWDLRAWLRVHGATNVDNGLVRGFYGGMFANSRHDRNDRLAAGVGVRVMLRVLLNYSGDMVYDMSAGMGEVVIAPILRALEARGVEVQTLHRVTNVGFSDTDDGSVAHVDLVTSTPEKEEELTRKLPGTSLSYFPFTCPRLVGEQDGAKRPQMHRQHPDLPGAPKRLERGVDFHHVVLAIPPDAQPESVRRRPEWEGFFLDPSTRTRSLGTVGVQLWMRPDVANLGWSGPRPVVGGYLPPLDTWCDMTHVLATEGWPPGQLPRSLAFLCGVRQEPDEGRTQEQQETLATQQLSEWLEGPARRLWQLPEDPDEAIDECYVVASISPTDRYVLSLPGTIDARPRPKAEGLDNLSFAGDWVKNDLDCGAAESAVYGGVLAALDVLVKRKVESGANVSMMAEQLRG